MAIIPRIRLDIALGLLVAGTIWCLANRARNREETMLLGNGKDSSEKEEMVEGSLEVLKPLLLDPALLERILLSSDPKTSIRVAQVSKLLNEMITSSPSLQLVLRQYYHQLPPIAYPSASQRSYLTRQPKKRQLDDLLDREERLSRFRHTKMQRCTMPYIDVLCSGDYTIVTRCLSGRYRTEGIVESGQVEDGYTVMVPRDSNEQRVVEEDEDKDGKETSKRKDRLEGFAQRTVDVGEEIADIAVRADEDLIIIATNVPEDQVITQPFSPNPAPKVIRLAFYHLEAYTPHSPDSEFASPIPHAGAKLAVAEFAFQQSFTSIRLRAGPEGKLLIWGKNDVDKEFATALLYDWKQGKAIGYAWNGDTSGQGIPHDFTFYTPEILILAVLKTVEPGSNGYTPSGRDSATRLEVQTWRLPDPELYAQSHQRLTRSFSSAEDTRIPNGFDFISLSSCRLDSTYRFPSFAHRWRNPDPDPRDEIPAENGQTFNLYHCSVAAKPAPVTYASDESGAEARQGVLCVTIEGDFGPFTHPGQGPAHDHGAIAFCTVSGSAFSQSHKKPRGTPKIYDYEDWNTGNVSWEFGPMNTWVTGYGTRTALVTRYVGISQVMDDELNWVEDQTPQRTLVMSVTVRNYDPVAVGKRGKIYRHPLGRPAILGDNTWKPTLADSGTATDTETGVPDQSTVEPGLAFLSAATQLDDIFDNLTANMNMNVNVNIPNIPLPMPGQGPGPLHQLNDLLRHMSTTQGPGNGYKVIKSIGHGKRPELFGDYIISSTMPYYEANVTIPIPMPTPGEGSGDDRDEAAMEHPFKTILGRDRLIVCDDTGFDVLSI